MAEPCEVPMTERIEVDEPSFSDGSDALRRDAEKRAPDGSVSEGDSVSEAPLADLEGASPIPRDALSAGDTADAGRAEDHALVRRAQAGDESAFESLVKRHEQRAWRVARNLVASDEDAHDLAQEAFLRVFRSLSSFDFQHGFTTWLYRIVTNLAIDHLRKRRTAVSTTRSDPDEGDFDLPDANVERPSDGLDRDELALEVRACLAALAPHFQSVLMLREMEGLPCNEIAHIVGATHVTVRWRLHRGRKLFQEEWERRNRLSDAPARGRRANANAGERVDAEGREDEDL
jgi:RNA polymerase sigma-70 factor (ECF subfamily)